MKSKIQPSFINYAENYKYSEIIRMILAKKKISQSKLANSIGMNQSSLNIRINESSKTKFTIDEAINLCCVLGVSLNDVFFTQTSDYKSVI